MYAARAQKCAGLCSGSPFFNTQYGIQCWCGDADTDFDQHGASNEAECDIPCAGNAGEDCGGFYWGSVYSNSAGPGVTPAPVDGATPAPVDGSTPAPVDGSGGGGFTLLGCYPDVEDTRYCHRELLCCSAGLCEALCAAVGLFWTRFGVYSWQPQKPPPMPTAWRRISSSVRVWKSAPLAPTRTSVTHALAGRIMTLEAEDEADMSAEVRRHGGGLCR